MAELIFATKGAAEAIAAQEKLNQAANDAAKAYDELGEAAQEAGEEAKKAGKKGEEAAENEKKKREEARKALLAASREQERVGRIAEQITKRNETAQERYNRLLGDARKALMETELSMESYHREVQALNKEMEDGSGRFAQFKQSHEESFGDAAIASIGKYAAALISVSAVTGAITEQLRAQQELRDKDTAGKLSVSETRNVVIRNLGGASDATVRQVLQENQQLANQIKVSERFINLARADALSATGGDLAASLSAVSVASKFLRDKPDSISLFTGALTDLAKATGTNDAMVNLGFLSTIASQSRVVNPQQQAANIPRSVIGQLSFGATPQEAAALFAALTSGSADFTGSTSSTAAVSLAEQLSRVDLPGAKTMGDRIRALQKDRGAANAFLADASFEKVVLGPIRELLLDPNSAIAKQFAANLRGLPGNAGLALEGQRSLDRLGLNDLNAIADRGRALQVLDEQGQLRTRTDRLTTEEIEAVRSALARGGRDSIDMATTMFLRGFGGVSIEEAIRELEIQRQRVQHGTAIPALVQPDAEKTLQDMINYLKQVSENTAETNRKLEDSGLVGVAE